jgi:hypothetical protein
LERFECIVARRTGRNPTRGGSDTEFVQLTQWWGERTREPNLIWRNSKRGSRVCSPHRICVLSHERFIESILDKIQRPAIPSHRYLIGIAAAIIIYLDSPNWKTALLMALVIWSFCRFYYFAFYVIEKYVDPNYKFSGLISFAKYLLRSRH